jgi:hypothetical protein
MMVGVFLTICVRTVTMKLVLASLCAGAVVFMLRFLAALLRRRKEPLATAGKSLFREVQSS